MDKGHLGAQVVGVHLGILDLVLDSLHLLLHLVLQERRILEGLSHNLRRRECESNGDCCAAKFHKYFRERMAHLEKSRGVLAEDLGAVHDLLATGLRDKVGTEVFGLVHCPEV